MSALNIATQGLLSTPLNIAVQGFWSTVPSGGIKTFAFSLAESILLNISIGRGRGVGFTVDAAETVAAAFGRIKTLTLYNDESQSVTFGAVTRARGFVTAIEQAVQHSFDVRRLRTGTFTVAASEAVELAVGRARTVQGAINEQVLDGFALNRLRGVAASVLEGIDYAFTVTIWGPDTNPDEYTITMAWEQWEQVGDEVCLTPKTITWTYQTRKLA
jgi:hypothetical protein